MYGFIDFVLLCESYCIKHRKKKTVGTKRTKTVEQAIKRERIKNK